MAARPVKAMVFAAGLGTRMRPLTDDRPKALVEVAGRTLIDHLLDRLDEAGVETAVVNAFHFADKLADHLDGRSRRTGGRGPAIVISREDGLDEPLETDGGMVRALPLFGPEPDQTIFTCNADALWTQPGALERMARSWDPGRMDSLLLLAPLNRSLGFDGKGDFFLGDDGRLTRRGDAPSAPFAFAGIQIIQTRHFVGRAAVKRSLNRLWFDTFAPAGRLFGHVLDGDWLHVGDPAARNAAEARLLGRG